MLKKYLNNATEQVKKDMKTIENLFNNTGFMPLKILGQGICKTCYEYKDYAILKYNGDNPEWNDMLDVTEESQLLHELEVTGSTPKIFGYDEENRYFVVERIKGVTLSKYLRNITKKYDDDMYCKIIDNMEQQYDDMIDHIMECGYLPYDLHGANIMVTDDRKIKIIDVGAFKEEDDDGFFGYDRDSFDEILNMCSEFSYSGESLDTCVMF